MFLKNYGVAEIEGKRGEGGGVGEGGSKEWGGAHLNIFPQWCSVINCFNAIPLILSKKKEHIQIAAILLLQNYCITAKILLQCKIVTSFEL